MKKTYGLLKKVVVFTIGIIVIIIGIILLVVPGPGLLTIVLGLLILSSEFKWAEKYTDKMKTKIHDVYEEAKRKHQKFSDKEKKK